MIKKTAIDELKIFRQNIIPLKDYSFNANNVCIVTGAASGIGRATAIAAATNNLMTVGIDMDNKGGRLTQHMAREMGGQMIFIKTDYRRDDQLQHAVSEAAKMGAIKYLANIAISAPGGLDPDLLLQKNVRQHKIMLRMPAYLSELAMSHMLKSSDGTGVIGNLAWHPAGSTLLNNATQPSTAGRTAVDRKNTGVNFFTISIAHEDVSSPPEPKQGPGKMKECASIYRETMKDFFSYALDIANMFIFGFSRYAGCLTRGNLVLKKGRLFEIPLNLSKEVIQK